MANAAKMVSQVRYSVVDGTAQQILAVVEFGKAHPFSLSISLTNVSLCTILFLRKSCYLQFTNKDDDNLLLIIMSITINYKLLSIQLSLLLHRLKNVVKAIGARRC